MANSLSIWNKSLAAIMEIPGARVNRTKFLESELRQYCDESTINNVVNGRIAPYEAINKRLLGEIAERRINYNKNRAAASSFVMGLPGGFAVFATLPADMVQYYYFLFKTAQELAYLYGFPSFCDTDGELTERSLNTLTILIGVMSNDAATTAGLKIISKQLIEQMPKIVFYDLAREVAKSLGLRITQRSFAYTVGKAVPLFGGIGKRAAAAEKQNTASAITATMTGANGRL